LFLSFSSAGSRPWFGLLSKPKHHATPRPLTKVTKNIAARKPKKPFGRGRNVILFLFTAVLAVISTIQIRFLIRADKTSEAASIAALKTAETAIVQAAHMDRSR
jgi:hypothetical protein